MNVICEIFRQRVNLVLFGYKGSGKSSTGNTIINKKIFKHGASQVRLTNEIESHSAPNVNLTVIDTPGLEKESEFTRIKSHTAKLESQNVKYAIVVRIGRTTNEEIELIDTIMKRNKKELLGKTIMIMTNLKELWNEDNIESKRTFDSWLDDSPNLKKIVERYGLQYLQFENVNASKEEKKSYVNSLLMLLEIPSEGKSSEEEPLNNLDIAKSAEEKNNEVVISVTENELRKQFGSAVNIKGPKLETNVFLSRTDIVPPDTGFPFQLKRRHFLVRPIFAMAINKAQRQTPPKIRIVPTKSVFSHGKLYGGIFEDETVQPISVLPSQELFFDEQHLTYNIVYNEVNRGHY
ncbi:unnamed protein product [Mytilus coruscus]|uniref:AIG1-type G domain-containing protein n=1 Tax=Mytilus coruscus TaxID=42192 RepID=A0A6J8DAT3_MYTCO|nr:unnamed protein product [Mytilus coruscus]